MAVEETESTGTTEPTSVGPRWDLVALSLLACLVAGAVTGVVWWLVAPLPEYQVLEGRVLLPEVETETAVAADGWFALCAAAAGLLSAVAVFLRVRAARISALIGLTLGGLLASVVAWWVGITLGPASVMEEAKGVADGDLFSGPLEISAPGVLLIWSLTSLIVYFALAAGLDRDRSGRSGRNDDPGADRFNHPSSGGG